MIAARVSRGAGALRPATRSLALAVTYAKNGPAEEVYQLTKVPDLTGEVKASQVALKFLAAPINPADINLAAGNYGKSVPLPAVGGNEGVAKVTAVGSGVTNLKVGDWVLPAKAPFGTWTQEARAEASELIPIRNDIPAAYAATLAVNPSTALRLLNDFTTLKAGDVIIQNGANSMVGQAVIQLAKERGIKTINIIRSDRPDYEQTLALLTKLGGDYNCVDSFVGTDSFLSMVDELAAKGGIKLALNCTGGESATDLARVLAPGASIVTYGAMAKKPLSLPADLLSAKQLKVEGFWMSEWAEKSSVAERKAMYDELAALVAAEKLTFFYEVHDFDDFQYALAKSQEPFRFRKVVLNLDFPDRMAEHDALPETAYEVFRTTV